MPHIGSLPRVIGVAAVLLLAGFGDGVGFSLATLTGQRSPWIFMLPILVLPLGVYLIARGPSALRHADRVLIGAFSAFAALVLLVEYWFVGDFYVAGLIQLFVFAFVATLVCGVFASAPEWLDAAFRRSLPIVHYFLSGYLVFSYLSWHFLSLDPSIRRVLTSTSPYVEGYYGFRPSGFSAEPQWAAIALAASYLGIHYLLPRQRLNAFLALLVAAEALQSGTGYAFVAVVVVLYAFNGLRALQGRRRAMSLIAIVGTIAAVAALAIGMVVASLGVAQPSASAVPSAVVAQPSASAVPSAVVAQPPAGDAQPPLERAKYIVAGQDPSTAMRLTSAIVAWRVIEQSFPLGVGYGNFRKYAVYPRQFVASLPNFDELGYYKSDFFVLNYVAELGVLGAILVIWVGGLLIRTRHALAIAFVVLIAGLSGTVLLPPVLAVAAVVGLLVRDAQGTTVAGQRGVGHI